MSTYEIIFWVCVAAFIIWLFSKWGGPGSGGGMFRPQTMYGRNRAKIRGMQGLDN